MAEVSKREPRTGALELVPTFEALMDEWFRSFPFRMMGRGVRPSEDLIRIDEFEQDGDLVVRAELPGIDPEKDVEITVADDVLHISAHREQEEKVEEAGYVRQELRYGSFTRDLPLPRGAKEEEITARYKDGILEVHIPAPRAEEKQTRIAVAKE